MSDVLKLLLVAGLWLTASTMDYHTVVVTEQLVASVEPYVSPLDRPKCPRRNVEGKELSYEARFRADGGDETHVCGYGDV